VGDVAYVDEGRDLLAKEDDENPFV